MTGDERRAFTAPDATDPAGAFRIPGSRPAPPVVVLASRIGHAAQAARDLALDPRSWVAVTSRADLRRLRALAAPTGLGLGAQYVVADEAARAASWWPEARDLLYASGLVERGAR